MKLLVILALCGSVALAPVEMGSEPNVIATTAAVIFCAETTPCGWAVYNQYTKAITNNITNTYCICPEGLICTTTEDDTAVTSYIHRCRSEDFEFEYSDR